MTGTSQPARGQPDGAQHDAAIPTQSRPPSGLSYLRFIWHLLKESTEGSWRFYVWMTVLTAVSLVGVDAWADQVVYGLATTGMSDHVSWGLYIANFTFGVGLAAGGVLMVIPGYLYDDAEMHDLAILGELMAIAAIAVCLLFVTVDLGRPDRFWHLIPGVGRFNWPLSMLTWDVLVLNGYLVINLHILGYLLYQRYRGRRPAKRWYVPVVFISIGWAVSIHTVTAFLYSGLGGRPFWNSALLAPRFITSAFVSAPALLIIALEALRHLGRIRVPRGPTLTLLSILRITLLINLFMLLSELFTVFYTGGQHATSATYLFFGLHGHSGLVPWIWTAVVLNSTSLAVLFTPAVDRPWVLLTACAAAFVGVWIEKGMGLIVPGFIPSTLHEIVEYAPTLNEWKITAGIWALGLMVFTVGFKLLVPVLAAPAQPQPTEK